MKILFLGTSFGAPSQGRHQQSILVETDDGHAYLVDAGAPVLDVLVNRGYDLKKITGVFLTHLHGDHINGMFDILNLMDFYGMAYTVFSPEQRGIDVFRNYSTHIAGAESAHIRYSLIQEGLFYSDGHLKAFAYKTHHMEASKRPSYGFLLEADNKKVYITGDMHTELKDFPRFVYEEKVDMLISECAHFSVEAVYTALKGCLAEKVAFVHVAPPDKYAQLRQCAESAAFLSVFPADGEVYTI